jgi:AcrR family transcriptional regulator
MPDRRVQRTRQLLQHALVELIAERSYDTVAIQDIAERANLGRTTFYLHFKSKDELLVSLHEVFVPEFYFGPMTREELLSPDPSSGLVALYQHFQGARTHFYHILQGKDGALILRGLRDRSAQAIEDSLRAAFAEDDSAIPFNLLANYLAGSQIALLVWWSEKRQPYTPEYLAQTFHRLQRAAICEALGMRD